MYTMTLGVGRFCPEGGNGEFSTGCQKDFFRGANSGQINFNYSKLIRIIFSAKEFIAKHQIEISMGGP